MNDQYMNAHQKFMKQAHDTALKSARKGTGPFGCVGVKKRRVLAEGANQVTTLNDPSAHAEIQAI